MEKSFANIPEDVLELVRSKKEMIKLMLTAECEKLSRFEVDEKFLNRKLIGGNKSAEQLLGANQSQQKSLKEYIAFLVEQYTSIT